MNTARRTLGVASAVLVAGAACAPDNASDLRATSQGQTSAAVPVDTASPAAVRSGAETAAVVASRPATPVADSLVPGAAASLARFLAANEWGKTGKVPDEWVDCSDADDEPGQGWEPDNHMAIAAPEVVGVFPPRFRDSTGRTVVARAAVTRLLDIYRAPDGNWIASPRVVRDTLEWTLNRRRDSLWAVCGPASQGSDLDPLLFLWTQPDSTMRWADSTGSWQQVQRAADSARAARSRQAHPPMSKP